MIGDGWEDLYTSFLRIDKRAGLAHGPQMCCLLRFCVFYHCSGFIHRIIYEYSYAMGIFLFLVLFTTEQTCWCMQQRVRQQRYSILTCISNYLCGFYILVLMNLGYFLYFSHMVYEQTCSGLGSSDTFKLSMFISHESRLVLCVK